MTESPAPRLSVVIPTYNASATLAEQLGALAASIDDDIEVLVVENRSTDDSRAIAIEFAAADPRFRVVDATDRQGEPHARNMGVAAARSDSIAFCDADDVVAPTWATAMHSALQKHQFVTGPLNVDCLNPAWLAGVRGRRLFTEIPGTAGGTPFAHGCNFGVQRSAFDAVGGFDESWLIGCDVDFAIRLDRTGVAPTWVPEAVVGYRHRRSGRERWRQGVSFGRATERLARLSGHTSSRTRRCWQQRRRFAWLIVRSPKLYRRAFRVQWSWTLALVVGEVCGHE